ncbi:MAG: ABC transporter permease [Bacteroidetes bacterium]|nr:ABC transporter permease [Bacteroidota bacterium]
MFDFDKWQEIFNSIRRHKVRTFLTALGVFWGIFMLVLFLGAGDGLHNGVEHEFSDDAANSIWVRRGWTSMTYKGLPKGRRIQFHNDDFDYLKEQFKEIDNITARFYLSGSKTVKYKDQNLSFSVRGVHPDHLVIENSRVIKGRNLNETDIKEIRKSALIGKVVDETLFKDEEALGKEINIGGIVYKVVGVYEDSGGEDEMRLIYLPVSTVQKVYSGTDELHQIMFTGGDLGLDEMKELEYQVRAAIAQRHQFDVNDRRALFISNIAEEYQKFQSLFFAINIFVWFVGIGSILAGVIGVSNIMLIIVKDRTKEIGIRKAIGATPGSIVAMILQEAIFITALAGYFGMLAGIGVISLLSSMEVEYFRNPQVDLGVAAIATAILVIAGALAGLWPALQAARIHPIEAMRN